MKSKILEIFIGFTIVVLLGLCVGCESSKSVHHCSQIVFAGGLQIYWVYQTGPNTDAVCASMGIYGNESEQFYTVHIADMSNKEYEEWLDFKDKQKALNLISEYCKEDGVK